ncbi:MAG: alpha/beta fold hydrolase [Betaproteobacteria bacterium]
MPQPSADLPTGSPSGFALGEPSWLDAGDGHRLAWWQGGSASGVPLLLLHGGPGGQTRPESVALWHGLPVRWIAFDQRGCGRSEPAGETRHNTLDALLGDIERLRAALGIERWALAAGSWGALLALACLRREPSRVRALFLRSPFTGSRAEVERYLAPWFDWLGAAGRAALGGDADALPRLFQGTTARHAETAIGGEALLADAWSRFDDAQSQPGGVAARAARWSVPAQPAAPAPAWRVFGHYAAHGWFLERPLVEALPARSSWCGPLGLVHGALDACCDPATSRALARWHGAADHVEVAEGGHRMAQPAMATALRAAAERWLARI